MIRTSSAKVSSSKLARNLSVIVTILMVMVCAPAWAGQLSTAPAGAPKQQSHGKKAKPQQATSRARTTTKRHAATAATSKAKKKPQRKVKVDLALKSRSVLVVDQDSGEMLAMKNANVVAPIASLTKLMTALVVIEAGLPMDEKLQITSDDIDKEKNTHSRLKVGTRLSRAQMLLLALMSSENRAALALSRNYPGGREAFLKKMNLKAAALGMASTHFVDSAGLSKRNVSTAHDLHRLLRAAYAKPLIRSYSTQPETTVRVGAHALKFVNSNRLVRKAGDWDIELQKTGFTNEAGRCLVMQTTILSRRLAMIFLDSNGTLTRYADAARVRKRLEIDAKSVKRSIASAVATPTARVP